MVSGYMWGSVMSRKAKLKLMIFLGGLGVSIITIGIGLRALFHLIASFQEGADPDSAFHGFTIEIPDPDQAMWLSTIPQSGGKVPRAAEQEEILSSYWAAWQSLSNAYHTGNTEELLAYWTGTAYEQILATLPEDITLTTEHHQLDLLFFSEDSSIVRFEDQRFTLAWQGAGVDFHSETTALVTMTLDQGYWRIRLIEFHHSPR